MLKKLSSTFLIITVTLFLLMILSCSYTICSNQVKNNYIIVDKLPQLGQKLENKIIEQSEEKLKMMIMTSSGSIQQAYFISCDRIKYTIAINNNNIVQYISVADTNFVTRENISVKSTLQDVLKIVDPSMKDIIKEPGWAFYVNLPSGWKAAFTEGETMTEKKPTDESKVKWFFIRL